MCSGLRQFSERLRAVAVLEVHGGNRVADDIRPRSMHALRSVGRTARCSIEAVAVLAAGGSRYAYVLLQDYGIDLATDAPYDALIARMDRVMDQIESILDTHAN